MKRATKKKLYELFETSVYIGLILTVGVCCVWGMLYLISIR